MPQQVKVSTASKCWCKQPFLLLCFLDLIKDWAIKTFNRVAIVAFQEHKIYFSLLLTNLHLFKWNPSLGEWMQDSALSGSAKQAYCQQLD